METLVSIFGGLLSGASITAFLNWYSTRKRRNVEESENIMQTYIRMLENQQKLIIQIGNDRDELHMALIRYEKLVSKASSCPVYYSSACPVRIGLVQYGKDGKGKQTGRKNGNVCGTGTDNGTGTGAEYISKDTGIQNV